MYQKDVLEQKSTKYGMRRLSERKYRMVKLRLMDFASLVYRILPT